MKLTDLGEDALVARWTRGLPRNATLLVGPGDDCAVVGRRSDAVWTLLKTDCVIEGVHFTTETDFVRVGWKALARNVSDIAAMGGTGARAHYRGVPSGAGRGEGGCALQGAAAVCAEIWGLDRGR